ncbi:hypothetical protein VN97_g10020 [Penicillium thymicola]|uniref:Uncharacterized protein n=1 Tax=Penicillium thymicola TaxID=293382 RepID=A0AAI9T9U6_PENTH|nr:hypothetical protein VN97_g10020 [Penicillium thymicola]
MEKTLCGLTVSHEKSRKRREGERELSYVLPSALQGLHSLGALAPGQDYIISNAYRPQLVQPIENHAILTESHIHGGSITW